MRLILASGLLDYLGCAVADREHDGVIIMPGFNIDNPVQRVNSSGKISRCLRCYDLTLLTLSTTGVKAECHQSDGSSCEEACKLSLSRMMVLDIENLLCIAREEDLLLFQLA